MAAPNPSVRISPSGPIAQANDPFSEYAGMELVGQNSSSAGSSNLTSMGADGSGTESRTLTRENEPNAGVSDALLVSLNGDSDIDSFGMDAGKWYVEAQIQVGFNTSDPPSSNAEMGGITAVASFINDSGVIAGGSPLGNTQIRPSIVPVLGVSSLPTFGVIVLGGIIEITDEDIANNNEQPITGVELLITRAQGTSAGMTYNGNSGTMAVGADTKVKISRFR